MATQTQFSDTKTRNTQYLETLQTALKAAGANDSDKAAEAHYDFLAGNGEWDTLKDNDFHLRGRTKKWAAAYHEARQTEPNFLIAAEKAYAAINAARLAKKSKKQQDTTPQAAAPEASESSADTTATQEQDTQPAPPAPMEAGRSERHHRSVVTFPSSSGALYDTVSGLTFNVSMEDGGTAEEALRQIKEWRKLATMSEQYGIRFMVEKKLATGMVDSIAIDKVIFITQAYQGSTDLYAQLWRNGRDYADLNTRDAKEIALIAQGLGVKPESGKEYTGSYTLHFELGNLKRDRDTGEPKAGTQNYHYYWNVIRLDA